MSILSAVVGALLLSLPPSDLNDIRIAPRLSEKPSGALESDVACPQDFLFDSSYRLCRGARAEIEDEFVVPRTSSIRLSCELLELGSFCRSYKVWPKAIVDRVLGQQRCPLGSGWDQDYEVCRDSERVYGPFTWKQTQTCLEKKCGGSCASSDWGASCLLPVSKTPDPRFVVEMGRAVWRPEWSEFTQNTILRMGKNLLKADPNVAASVENLCPRYNVLTAAQRARFWTVAMASISYYESAFNPRTRFFEPPPLSKYSEGLFQLSLDDGGYGRSCDFLANGRDILDPFHNIECAIQVLDRQLVRKGEFFTPGYFYYWSVLRNKIPEITQQIVSRRHLMPFCQQKFDAMNIDWFDSPLGFQDDIEKGSELCVTDRFLIHIVDKPEGPRYLSFARSAPQRLALSLYGSKIDDDTHVFGKDIYSYVVSGKEKRRLAVYENNSLLFEEKCM